LSAKPAQFTFFHMYNFSRARPPAQLLGKKCQNFTILQVSRFYNFQALPNHRANACSCFILAQCLNFSFQHTNNAFLLGRKKHYCYDFPKTVYTDGIRTQDFCPSVGCNVQVSSLRWDSVFVSQSYCIKPSYKITLFYIISFELYVLCERSH
jgi:hypothetical protein